MSQITTTPPDHETDMRRMAAISKIMRRVPCFDLDFLEALAVALCNHRSGTVDAVTAVLRTVK